MDAKQRYDTFMIVCDMAYSGCSKKYCSWNDIIYFSRLAYVLLTEQEARRSRFIIRLSPAHVCDIVSDNVIGLLLRCSM